MPIGDMPGKLPPEIVFTSNFQWFHFTAERHTGDILEQGYGYIINFHHKLINGDGNLIILNVDGCIGILFLDALASSKQFTESEINEILEIGYMNGLFALARSIGIIGHILDQKRLKEPLYRHPTDDILYLE